LVDENIWCLTDNCGVKEIQLSEKYKQHFVVSSEGLVGKI
jgi:hypothetical protein